MEILEGGSIFDTIVALNEAKRTLPESSVKSSFKSFIIALDSLHQKGYIHRDLNSQNIVAVDKSDGYAIKLIDFGFMERLPESGVLIQTGSYFGTPGCLAPETIHSYEYSTRTDIWQAGCILYTMLCGYPVRRCTCHNAL
jgi:serine/threonine protein kinase